MDTAPTTPSGKPTRWDKMATIGTMLVVAAVIVLSVLVLANTSAIRSQQKTNQAELTGITSLVQFVATYQKSPEASSSPAAYAYFEHQLANICKATPGCTVVPFPKG